MLQVYYQIFRYLHKSRPLMKGRKTMAGVRHRLEALENAPDLVDDPETLEELESDFMHVGKTHRQHETEYRAAQERVRHIMVKNKYFREQRLPNLLLYAEKEEMRSLHSKDPEEWTIERLAESFPATPHIVKKIVNSNWRPQSTKRIREHDEAVIRNWEQIRQNNDLLPPDLREHISKFTARNWNHLSTAVYEKELVPKMLPKPRSNEFSSIITSCKEYAEKPNEKVTRSLSKTQKVPDPEDETYLLDKVIDKRRMRLEDWRKNNVREFPQLEERKVEEEQDFDKKPNSDDSKIIVSPENPSGTGYIEKYATATNEIVISAEDSKRYEMSTYKVQIHIPRKLWRKGGTYRIEDCYYDDDGEFLYRVPGMSGTQPRMDSSKKTNSEE